MGSTRRVAGYAREAGGQAGMQHWVCRCTLFKGCIRGAARAVCRWDYRRTACTRLASGPVARRPRPSARCPRRAVPPKDAQDAGDALTCTQVASGRRPNEYLVILRYYWPRLLVTCLAWLVNDFAFYGRCGRGCAVEGRGRHALLLAPVTCLAWLVNDFAFYGGWVGGWVWVLGQP